MEFRSSFFADRDDTGHLTHTQVCGGAGWGHGHVSPPLRSLDELGMDEVGSCPKSQGSGQGKGMAIHVTSASQRDGWGGATFCPLCSSPDWEIQILQFPEEEESFV